MDPHGLLFYAFKGQLSYAILEAWSVKRKLSLFQNTSRFTTPA